MSALDVRRAIKEITETFEVRYEAKLSDDGKRRPLNSVGNLALLVLGDPSWIVPSKDLLERRHAIAHDVRTGVTVKRGICPWPSQLASIYPPTPNTPFNETDLALLQGWFELKHGVRVSRQACKEVVAIVAHKNTFDSSGMSLLGSSAKILPRTHAEFMALEPTPQESICGEWFPTSALGMLSGDSGAGKTWFCLDFALSVACGVPFMRWAVPKARKVLIVSGEDRLPDLKNRIAALLKAKTKAAGRELEPQLTYLAAHDRALLPNGLPNLGTPEGRALVEACLEGVKLLILDNYGALFNGIDENEAKEFAPIQDWLFSLSVRGVAVLLVVHNGKGGDYRGTSKAIAGMNAAIILNHPSHWKAKDGASFDLKFKKSRDSYGAEVGSFSAKLGADEDGDLCWLFNEAPPTIPAREKVAPKTTAILELHAQGKTATEIRAAGFSKSMVQKVLSSPKASSPKVAGASSTTDHRPLPPIGVVVVGVVDGQTTQSPVTTETTERPLVVGVVGGRATQSPSTTATTEKPSTTEATTERPSVVGGRITQSLATTERPPVVGGRTPPTQPQPDPERSKVLEPTLNKPIANGYPTNGALNGLSADVIDWTRAGHFDEDEAPF